MPTGRQLVRIKPSAALIILTVFVVSYLYSLRNGISLSSFNRKTGGLNETLSPSQNPLGEIKGALSYAPASPDPKKKTLDPTHALDSRIAELNHIAQWQKPAEIKVIGLVFYGRKRFVSILECYLRRNLVVNGGVLDEVHFVAKTDDQEDLHYLEQLLTATPQFSAEFHNKSEKGYSQMYKSCEKGKVYVKIDDDVLFIEDSTIRSIVKRKIEHPEYAVVSANLVVQFALSWIHMHLGAIHPYLPDLSTTHDAESPRDWRASALPMWKGPEDWNMSSWKAPKHHRWLPLEPGSPKKDETPIVRSKYDSDVHQWNSWMAAAQQHHSFLENLERGELWRYDFDIWDAIYNRVSINLIAMTGDDIQAMQPIRSDDEYQISCLYPEKTKRHVVIDGHGVAVHWGYRSMSARKDSVGLEATDVLDRYRLYAEENVCGR